MSEKPDNQSVVSSPDTAVQHAQALETDRPAYESLGVGDVHLAVLGSLESCQCLANASQVCKAWQLSILTDPAASEHVWETVYNRTFPQHTRAHASRSLLSSSNSSHRSWRSKYMRKWQLDRNWARGQRTLLRVNEGHQGWVNTVKCGPHGTVLSGGADQQLTLWGSDGTQLHTITDLKAGVWCVDIGADSMVAGCMDGGCITWDVETGKQLRALASSHAHNPATAVQLSVDQNLVMVGHMSGSLQIWDQRTSGIAQTMHMAGERGTTYGTGVGEAALPTRWHPRHPSSSGTALFSAAMHDDIVVAGGRDGRMHMYDLRTVSKTAVVDGHERELFTMSMAYPRLATGSRDGTVKVWDLSKVGTSTAILPLGPKTFPSASWAAGCSAAASTSCLLGVGSGHRGHVFSVALSEDWRLASASEDGSVRVWDCAGLASLASGDGQHPQPKVLQPLHCFAPSTDSVPFLSSWRLGEPEGGGQQPAGAGAAVVHVPDDELAVDVTDDDDDDEAEGNGLELALSPCAVHGVDIQEELLCAGGRDALVRVYTYGQLPSVRQTT